MKPGIMTYLAGKTDPKMPDFGCPCGCIAGIQEKSPEGLL